MNEKIDIKNRTGCYFNDIMRVWDRDTLILVILY